MEFIGNGKSSLVYKDGDYALNVFFNQEEENVKKIFERLNYAKDAGLNVPKPSELTKVSLDKKDFEEMSLIGKYKMCLVGHVYQLKNIVGKELPAIKREFINGTPLSKFWFPRRYLRKELQKQIKNIKKAGMFFVDVFPSNFVLTPNKEVYIVDYESLHYKGEPKPIGLAPFLMRRRPPIGKLEHFATEMGFLVTGQFM